MTTLVKVYNTKQNRALVDKAILLLEQQGIQVFLTGITVNDQTLYDMTVYVQSHDQDKAELALDEVYSEDEVKLPGEFVCYEVQDGEGELKGLNVFYNGILQHTWKRAPKEVA